MLRLWQLYRGGGMGGGHLPEPGGAMDQPTVMLDAFAEMSRAEQDFRPKRGGDD